MSTLLHRFVHNVLRPLQLGLPKTPDYFRQMWKIAVLYLWATFLTIGGAVLDWLIPAFNISRAFYFTTFAISFVIANIALFAEQRDTIRRLEHQIEVLNNRIELSRERRPAELLLSSKGGSFGSGIWQGSTPKPPFIFSFDIDIRNLGDETGQITLLSVVEVNTGTNLVVGYPSGASWYFQKDNLVLPLQVEPDKWIQIHCRVGGDLNVRSLKDLAARLRELNQFVIRLTYTYETFTGGARQSEEVLTGSFGSFTAGILDTWRERNQHELLLIAQKNRQNEG